MKRLNIILFSCVLVLGCGVLKKPDSKLHVSKRSEAALRNMVDVRRDTTHERRERLLNPQIDFEKYPMKWREVRKGIISKLDVGSPIDDFTLDLPIWILNDSLGREETTLRNLSDQYQFVVLDFWARWCTPCLQSVAHWEEMHDLVKDDIAVVPVNIDWDFFALQFALERRWKNTQMIGSAGFFMSQHFLGNVVAGPNVWIKDGKFFGVTKAIPEKHDFIFELKTGSRSDLPDYALHPPSYKTH